MRKINFTKMVASGNDFVVINQSQLLALSPKLLAKKICDRKFGIGADGLLIVGKSKKANLKMRIFNADGSEAEMCGNGARCAALFLAKKSKIVLETLAGIVEAQVNSDKVKIKLTAAKDLREDIALNLNNRQIKVNFVNTGVPHTVIFTEGLEKIEVAALGRQIRNHKAFAPRGTNVNFVEVLKDNAICVRTYERGVEDETLACGTGSTASALIFALKSGVKNKVFVHTRGGEILTVYFDRCSGKFCDVWLEGKAGIVYKGEYYV